MTQPVPAARTARPFRPHVLLCAAAGGLLALGAGCTAFPDPGGPPSRVAPDAPFPGLLPASQIAALETPPAVLTEDDPLLRRAAALRARAAALRRVDPGAG